MWVPTEGFVILPFDNEDYQIIREVKVERVYEDVSEGAYQGFIRKHNIGCSFRLIRDWLTLASVDDYFLENKI